MEWSLGLNEKSKVEKCKVGMEQIQIHLAYIFKCRINQKQTKMIILKEKGSWMEEILWTHIFLAYFTWSKVIFYITIKQIKNLKAIPQFQSKTENQVGGMTAN